MCAFTDHWEIEGQSESEIWPLMVGKPQEDPEETRRQVEIILDGIPRGFRVLEVGAGVGRLLKAISATGRFDENIGVDSSMSLVMASSDYLQDRNGKVMILLNDGLHLPYPDRYFDFVYSFTCFQHMISLAIIHRNLIEIQRVLMPKGVCRIQTIASGDRDPRSLKEFDGRVFGGVYEFAHRFTSVGLDVEGVQEGLTHPEHIWVTAINISK